MNKDSVLRAIKAVESSVDAEIISRATGLILALPDDIISTPIVVPMTEGRIQFEWHKDDRFLELTFDSPDRIHYYLYDPDTDAENEGIINISNANRVHEILRWFSVHTD